MKTPILKFAALLMVATISLTGCKKDTASEDMNMESSEVTDTMTAASANSDTVSAEPADTTAIQSGGMHNESKNTGLKNKSAGDMRDQDSKSGAKGTKDGYGAADGTDAENHDGDQYTKNNPKPMPSGGTSIK